MDYFDLEQALMECWNTSGDIKLVSESLSEGDSSSEDIVNALIGLQKIHDLRCQKTWNIFEDLIHSGSIRCDLPSSEDTTEVTEWEYTPTLELEKNFSKKKSKKKAKK